MKRQNSKKGARPSKQAVAYLAARAAEAEKQAESARKLARLAKAKLKQARKAHKQAKKFAKQARKEAKAAAKALKNQLKRTRNTRQKKTPARATHPVKAPLRIAVTSQTRKAPKAHAAPPPRPPLPESLPTGDNGDPTIAQA